MVERSFLLTMTCLTMLFVIGPVLVVILIAFSSGNFFSFPPPGLSVRWFQAFFADSDMRGAFLTSIALALLAACGASLLGLLAALGVNRRKGGSTNSLQLLFMAPLVFPTIVLGLALLVVFRQFGVPTFTGLVFTHTLIGIPYCFRSTLAELQNFEPALVEASESLGASPLKAFFLVVLPIIFPGLFAGWLFAFVVSFGELNASLFLTGPGVVTLPIEIFSRLQFQDSALMTAAASATQVAVIIVIVFVAERLIGLARVVQR